MKIEDTSKIENEEDRVKAIYDIFDEGTRLSTKATQVEFLTTVRQIEKYLKPGMKILDLGAGTGEYSLYFAKKGFDVTAIELVENMSCKLKKKLIPKCYLKCFRGMQWIYP